MNEWDVLLLSCWRCLLRKCKSKKTEWSQFQREQSICRGTAELPALTLILLKESEPRFSSHIHTNICSTLPEAFLVFICVSKRQRVKTEEHWNCSIRNGAPLAVYPESIPQHYQSQEQSQAQNYWMQFFSVLWKTQISGDFLLFFTNTELTDITFIEMAHFYLQWKRIFMLKKHLELNRISFS